MPCLASTSLQSPGVEIIKLAVVTCAAEGGRIVRLCIGQLYWALLREADDFYAPSDPNDAERSAAPYNAVQQCDAPHILLIAHLIAVAVSSAGAVVLRTCELACSHNVIFRGCNCAMFLHGFGFQSASTPRAMNSGQFSTGASSGASSGRNRGRGSGSGLASTSSAALVAVAAVAGTGTETVSVADPAAGSDSAATVLLVAAVAVAAVEAHVAVSVPAPVAAPVVAPAGARWALGDNQMTSSPNNTNWKVFAF
eukprot:IDg9745t1